MQHCALEVRKLIDDRTKPYPSPCPRAARGRRRCAGRSCTGGCSGWSPRDRGRPAVRARSASGWDRPPRDSAAGRSLAVRRRPARLRTSWRSSLDDAVIRRRRIFWAPSGGLGDGRPGDELNADFIGCVGPDPTKKYRQAIAESNSRAQSERPGFDPATRKRFQCASEHDRAGARFVTPLCLRRFATTVEREAETAIQQRPTRPATPSRSVRAPRERHSPRPLRPFRNRRRTVPWCW